jgi:hypothetical protein
VFADGVQQVVELSSGPKGRQRVLAADGRGAGDAARF